MQISNNLNSLTKTSTINSVAIVSIVAAISFALVKSNSQIVSLFTAEVKTSSNVAERTVNNTNADQIATCHLPYCGGRLQDDSFNPNGKSPLIQPRTEDS